MVSFGRKDWKGAVMNFNFARNFEPAAPVITEKLAEAQAAHQGRRAHRAAGKPGSK